MKNLLLMSQTQFSSGSPGVSTNTSLLIVTSLSEQLKYLESISFNLLFNIIAFHD